MKMRSMEEEEDAQVSDEELSRSMDNGEDVTVASAGPDGSRHKCPECGKVFINRSVLNRHMRVHTGEKPYVCPQCHKAFSQLGNMTKHLKSHENAHLRWDRKTCSKPFKCPYPGCKKSFTAKTSLQSHLLSHQNEQESVDSTNEGKKETNQSNLNAHYAMISRHLRHHHYPSSVIFQGKDTTDDTCVVVANSNVAAEVASLPTPAVQAVSASPSQCLHNGCNQVFSSQLELREHLYSNSPGLVAEHQFLINTVLQFADIITSWDNKPPLEKDSLRVFAQSVKQAVEKMNTDLKSQSALLSNQTSREINPEMSSVAGTDRSDSTLAAIIPVLQQSMQVSTSQLSSHKLQAKASMPQANDYWMNNEIPSDQSKVNGQHLYYDPLHTDMDQYFEASSNTSPQFVDPQPTGAFSSLLHAHNNIIDAWGQHHIGSSSQSTGNQFASSIEGMQHHHRATMSWEEAIEKSQAMLSKGMTHPSIIINPCHSWEPFNLLDIFSDDVEAEEHDTKRQKSTHSSE